MTAFQAEIENVQVTTQPKAFTGTVTTKRVQSTPTEIVHNWVEQSAREGKLQQLEEGQDDTYKSGHQDILAGDLNKHAAEISKIAQATTAAEREAQTKGAVGSNYAGDLGHLEHSFLQPPLEVELMVRLTSGAANRGEKKEAPRQTKDYNSELEEGKGSEVWIRDPLETEASTHNGSCSYAPY